MRMERDRRKVHHHDHRNSHRHVSVDSYAYISGLKDWNTPFKVSFALLSILAVITADSPVVSVMTIAFMGVLSIEAGRIKPGDYFRLMLVPSAFIITGGIAVLIQVGAGVKSLLRIPFFSTDLYITEESLRQSLGLFGKAFGAVSALYMLALSTPMGEIISTLGKVKVPSIILELMHLIYRYIFILLETNAGQKEAAQSRLGYCDMKTSFRTFGSELANLLILSMKKSGEYYDALESRGYEGNCLFWEEKRKLTKKQVIWAAAYAGAVVILIILF